MPLPRITSEQYLELDRAADYRGDYYQGQMYAMAGRTLRHGMIVDECVAALQRAARPRRCRAYSGNVRVAAGLREPYFYPDVFVICNEPQFLDDGKDTVLNPVLILEVLSPSTEDFDRGRKFAAYAQIPSLREYILVAQDEPLVVVHSRQDENKWLLATYRAIETTIRLETLDADIPIGSFYTDVKF